MKPDKHKLDEYLQHKVEEANFTYKDEYWQNMSAILDDRDRKKNPFFRRGLYILLGLLMIGGAALFMAKLNHRETLQTTRHTTEEAAQQSNVPVSLSQDAIETPGDQTDFRANDVATSKFPANVTEAGKNTSLQEGNQQPNSPQTNTQPSQHTTKSTPVNHSMNTKAKPVQQDQSGETANADANGDSEHSRDRDVQQQGNQIVPAVSAKFPEQGNSIARKSRAKRQYINEQDRPVASASKHINSSNTARRRSKPGNGREEATTSTASIPLKPLSPAANHPSNSIKLAGREMTGTDTNRYIRRRVQDPVKTNPRYVPNLGDYVPVHLDSVTVITLKETSHTPAAVTPATALAPNNEAQQEKFKPLPYEYFVLTGLNVNKAWNGNVTNPVSWAYSPYFGLGMGRQVAPKLTLTMNAGFTYLNGLNTASSVSSYQYGFGLDSTTYTVAYKKLLQLYLPFSVYYKLATNHFLMLALGANWSMDVSSRVTETRTSNTGFPGNAAKQSVSTSSNQTGFRGGFNPFDVYAQIGYCYQVQQRCMLQLTAQQGFVDMTKNPYFSNNLRNTQTRISLGLKYTLH